MPLTIAICDDNENQIKEQLARIKLKSNKVNFLKVI